MGSFPHPGARALLLESLTIADGRDLPHSQGRKPPIGSHHGIPQSLEPDHPQNITMKVPFLFLSRARVCLILLALTLSATPDARCDLPFKRTLGKIKQRVGHVLQKIGREIDEDPSPPRDSRTQPIHEPEYGYPTVIYPQTEQRQPAANVYGPYGNTSAPLVPSDPASPPIVLRSSRQPATEPIIPVTNQQPQNDAVNRPALKDLDMDPASRRSQTSGPNTAIQGIPNDRKASVTTPSSAQTINYAKAVPGHPGFVYPPGVTEEKKNMLDVRGCASGEKMRDPRTGNTFMVP